jgi:Asp-tRNA(Asn)/Glu-tRNA(Gln) amidotransferase A subunit family amidase
MLRKAGAVILGKTVTTEFAYFHPGPTTNPHDVTRTPGGSSSGSAAAVADGMAPLGLGSQTAASVIRPASFCGVVGYKSRLGGFPMNGVSPLARSLDSFGWMTRSVTDAAIVFDALTGMNVDLDAAPPKIGVCRTPVWDKADPDMQALFERTAVQLADAGADVADVALPRLFDDLVDAQKTVMAFETAESMADLRRRSQDQLSPELITLLNDGANIDRGDYRSALALAERGRGEFGSLQFDALLAPSARGEAPVGLGSTGDPIFSRIWTLLGLPCLSLPVGVGTNGLPLGLQLIGPMNDEVTLFAAARWVEQTVS